MDPKSEIKGIIDRINEVTLGSRNEDLRPLFHENVTFMSPDFRTRAEGREACLKSYSDFRAAAQIKEYHRFEPQIDVTGATAVVTYEFRIYYAIQGRTNRDSGRDLLVFTRKDDRWVVAWRTVILSASERESG
jgi:ketosteroid isomerase-like protein